MQETLTLPPLPPNVVRKRGRPARGRQVARYAVTLSPDLHEWVMQQPEGMSGMVRQLLSHEQTKRQRLRMIQDKEKETRILLGTDLQAKRELLRLFLGLNITRLVCQETTPQWYYMFLDDHPKGEMIGKHKDFIRQMTWRRLAFECGHDRGKSAIHDADRKTWHMYRDVLFAIAEHKYLPEGWDGVKCWEGAPGSPGSPGQEEKHRPAI